MFARSTSILLLGCLLACATIIDRVAVIVGKHVVKASDIDRDLRVTDFLNGQPLDLSAAAKRKAADRLVEQSIIRDEIVKGAYTGAGESDVDAMIQKLQKDRFGGSSARMKQELARYGLTEDQLRTQLHWQIDVLKFIDERFRPGVLVTDEEIRTYYDRHTADLRRQFPELRTFQELEPKIRESLEGQRLNQNFEQWLAAARKRSRIDYREGALQ